jgi:anaerobic ribonucleoside-triphosphate reductase activating protein
MAQIEEEGFNVTFSGGDPLQQPIAPLTSLAKAIHDAGYTIWCYTGYRYEELCNRAEFGDFFAHIDVLVDGPFIESKRDLALHFRGSSNQRLIDMHHSTPGHIVLYKVAE